MPPVHDTIHLACALVHRPHSPTPTLFPSARRYEPYFTFVDAVRDLGRMLNERIDTRHESQEGEEDIDKMRRQMRSLASGASPVPPRCCKCAALRFRRAA